MGKDGYLLNHSLKLRIKGFGASLALVWLALATYHYATYYKNLTSATAQHYFVIIAVVYSLCALFFYALASIVKVQNSKPWLTFLAIYRIIRGLGSFIRSGPRDYHQPLVKMSFEEKRALLFNLVKFFFIPLMITYMVANYHELTNNLEAVKQAGQPLISVSSFNSFWYPFLFSLTLFIDVTFFVFGYLFEAGFLKNKIRSVEPTALGWIVALICYAPFNGLLSNYVNWYANDSPVGSTANLTFWIRLISLLFMIVYASASVALGPKASNLTNRGIVGYGPYRIIRHPAYTCKNIAWWITMLPVFRLSAVVGMTVWSSIYFMRAITEERHLSADPDYVAYCKKVKYRFIPGLI